MCGTLKQNKKETQQNNYVEVAKELATENNHLVEKYHNYRDVPW